MRINTCEKNRFSSSIAEFIGDNWALIIILLLVLILQTPNLSTSCSTVTGTDHAKGSCIAYSEVVQNSLDHGLLATKFGAVARVNSKSFLYYIHHPSLLFYLSLGLGARIFGNNPLVLRLVMMIFFMGSIIVLYLLTKEIWGKRTALFASFFFSLSPLAVLYGLYIDMVGFMFLFFFLLTLFFYIKWTKEPSSKYYWLMVGVFLIGSQADWPVYSAPFVIFFHHILTAKEKKKEILLFPLWALLSLALFLSYVHFLTGTFLGENSYAGGLLESAAHRMGSNAQDAARGITFTAAAFVNRIYSYAKKMVTPILLVLSSIWLIYFLRKFYKKEYNSKELFLFLLFLQGVIILIVFKQAAWIHEYSIIHLLPFLAISSAIILSWIISRIPREISVITAIVIILLFLLNLFWIYKKFLGLD